MDKLTEQQWGEFYTAALRMRSIAAKSGINLILLSAIETGQESARTFIAIENLSDILTPHLVRTLVNTAPEDSSRLLVEFSEAISEYLIEQKEK